MIKFKLVQRVPGNAAQAGFMRTPTLAPTKHVALIDYSSGTPENYDGVGIPYVSVSNYSNGSDSGSLPISLVSGRALAFSLWSVAKPGTGVPIPLFYRHRIGKGANQNSGVQRYGIYIDGITATGFPGGWTPGADAYADSLRTAVEVFDANGNPPDFNWDIQINSTRGVNDSDGVYSGVDTWIWVDRLPVGKTYYVRYQARDIYSGEVLPNHVEILNPLPVGSPCNNMIRSEYSPGYYYTVNVRNTSTIALILVGSGTVNVQGGVPVGPELGNVILEVTSDGITYEVEAGDDISIVELCKQINDLNCTIKAIPMSNARSTNILYAASFPATATRRGTPCVFPINGTRIVRHVKHREDMRITAQLPLERSPYMPWYPRINAGEFVVSFKSNNAGTEMWGFSEIRYTVPEFYNRQEWSPKFKPGIREVIDEPADVIDSKTIQVLRYPLYDLDFVKVYNRDREVINPSDADLTNGKLFFANDLTKETELIVSYAYKDNKYDYTELNINPTHNRELLGKYIGIYIVPTELRESNGDVSGGLYKDWSGNFSTTVYTGGDYSINTYGPVAEQLELFDLYGLVSGYNTDLNSQLYGYMGKSGGTYFIDIYKTPGGVDCTLPDPKFRVAYGTTTSDTGSMILNEQNSSGVFGVARIDYSNSGTFLIKFVDNRRSIHHVVANSVEEIENYVANACSASVFNHSGSYVGAKLLAIYHVGINADLTEIQMLDSRTMGGGLKDDVKADDYQDAKMNWDIGRWDGEPFQSAGAVVVSLPTGFDIHGTSTPDGVVTGFPVNPSGWLIANGYLTQEQIDDKIRKYLALGVYPIIDVPPSEG